MKMMFYSHANKSLFHKKCFALSLTSNVRVFGTKKLPIGLLQKVPRGASRILFDRRGANVTLSGARKSEHASHILGIESTLIACAAGGIV